MHSGDQALSSSGAHLRPKGNVSSHENHESKVNFTGVRRVAKKTKIKVNHQMSDLILSDSSSKATIFKQKYCIDRMFI